MGLPCQLKLDLLPFGPKAKHPVASSNGVGQPVKDGRIVHEDARFNQNSHMKT